MPTDAGVSSLAMTEIKQRPVSELKPHPLSLSIYGQQDNDADLLESIAADGILEPLHVKPDGTIISGHRRYRCAVKLGLETVPTIEVTFADEFEEQRAIIELNRQRVKTFSQKMREAEALARIERERARRRQITRVPGTENTSQLRQNSDEAGRTDEIVSRGVGLGSRDTYRKARYVWKAAQEGMPKATQALALLDKGDITIHKAYSLVRNAQDVDFPSHTSLPSATPILPFAQRGQLYVLAPRPGTGSRVAWLMCGDACSHDDMTTLIMGSGKAQLVHLDPPYGVGHDGGEGWDNLSPAELLALLTGALKEAHFASDDKAGLWLWYAMSKARIVLQALAQSGWQERNHVTWVKDHISGGIKGRLKAQSEPLYFAAKTGQSPRWNGPSDEKDVWFFQKPERHPNHPTPKPIPLVMRALEDGSSPGDLILDTFIGSGTTLVAATRIGREAAGMEIRPAYCDLAILNWLRDNAGGFVLTAEMAALFVLLPLVEAVMPEEPIGGDAEATRRVFDLVDALWERYMEEQAKVITWLQRCGIEVFLASGL